MKKAFILVALLVLGCASQDNRSEEATESLLDTWSPRIGTAKKSEFVEKFGNPEWCRLRDSGAETCRFYNKRGVKWLGPEKDRKSYIQYDQVIADFDGQDVLRSFEGDSQR